MAGVEAKKTTTKSVQNMKAHFDEQARTTNNHSNQHIDKTKTHLNYNLAYKEGTLTKDITWRELVGRCKKKVKELDEAKPPQRKVADRKDAYMFCVWCPNEMPNQEEFFRRFVEEYEKAFPESLMGAQVHMDEQHEYIDPTTKQVRLSMNHMHAFGVPNDKEKGCNMKAFMNREWFTKVNQICKEVAKEQGVEYHTGEGHHQSRTVEQMKVESAKALEEKLITLDLATQEQESTLQEAQEATTKAQEEVSTLKGQISDLTLNKESLIQALWNEVKGLWKDLTSQEKRQERLERMAGRTFGKATQLKENAHKELSQIMEQETIESVYLEEQPGLTRTSKAIGSYKEELDRVELLLQEDLEPDDSWDLE